MKSANKKRVSRHSTYVLRSTRTQYRYSPIDKAASEIRLMTLLPGAFGAKVRVTIRNTGLPELLRTDYEALSYAWGSAAEFDDIFVQEAEGERALAISKNLAEALQYLRYEDRSRVLWIDAICVDQRNISERGHQVLQMVNIYRQASRVVIWLGPERDDSTLAIQGLNALGSTVEVDWTLNVAKPLSGDPFDQWFEEPLRFAADPRTLASIECFLDRSWFKRLWIWQEVRLANDGALMICGGNCMSWQTFRNAVFCLCYKLLDWNDTNISHLMSVCQYDQSSPSLTTLLHNTRFAQCSDDRDKIYAILNLVWNDLGLEPDYSKSTGDVFKSVVLGYAFTMKDLRILSHCEMKWDHEMRIPSWVPDWTMPKECSLLDKVNASSTTSAQARRGTEDVLVVNGCLVATLDVIDIIPPITSGSGTEEMRKIARSLVAYQTGNEMYAVNDSMIDSVCRTLCCNGFAEGFMPLASDLPQTHQSKEYIRKVIDSQEVVKYERYVDRVWDHVEGRASFRTRNGHIGLGPQSIREGDQACMILGCDTLLILRSNNAGSYWVVGECYIDGFMEGEALLGALPSNWQRVRRHFPDLGSYYDAFIDTQTGEIQVEDPRLGPLPAGWRIADHRKRHAYNRFSNEEEGIIDTEDDPRLSPEALKARGVNLQEIRLV